MTKIENGWEVFCSIGCCMSWHNSRVDCHPKHLLGGEPKLQLLLYIMCAIVFSSTPLTLVRHFASHSSTSDFPNFSSSHSVPSLYAVLCIWWPSASIFSSGQTELLRNVPLFNGWPSGPQHGSISPSLTVRRLSFWKWEGGDSFQTTFPYNSLCLCSLHQHCGAVS